MRWIVVIALIALAGCSGSPGIVSMQGRSFAPERLTIGLGETVTWTNDSSEAHSVIAYQGGIPEDGAFFASGGAPDEDAARADVAASLLTEGEEFRVTFDRPGIYEYFCIPHEEQGMTGVVVVEP